MSIGKLDQRVTILEVAKTQGTNGEKTESESTLYEMWANVTDRGGGESIEAGQITAENVKLFEIRFVSGVTESHRILYDGEKYDILHIATIRRKCFLKIRGRKVDHQNY